MADTDEVKNKMNQDKYMIMITKKDHKTDEDYIYWYAKTKRQAIGLATTAIDNLSIEEISIQDIQKIKEQAGII